MKVNYHSLTISIKRKSDCYFLSLKAVGKLTVQDYYLITPILVSALSGDKSPKLDLLIDITQFHGWTLRAAWNDFILSIKHGAEFKRVAVFGGNRWQKALSNLVNWFIAGDVRYFDTRMRAVHWIDND